MQSISRDSIGIVETRPASVVQWGVNCGKKLAWISPWGISFIGLFVFSPSFFFFFSFFERDRRSQKRVARNRLKPRSIYPLDTFSLFSRVCDIAFIRRVATPSYTPPYHQFLNYHGRTDDDTVVANAPWSSFHSSCITTSISLHPNEPTSSFLSSPRGKRAFFWKRKWHFLRYGTFWKIIIFWVRNCWFLK